MNVPLIREGVCFLDFRGIFARFPSEKCEMTIIVNYDIIKRLAKIGKANKRLVLEQRKRKEGMYAHKKLLENFWRYYAAIGRQHLFGHPGTTYRDNHHGDDVKLFG